jgi:DNA-binding PadR family transcriptional regulator
MSKRPVSNPLALAVLSCLWERPMYPYEMTTTLRERGKEDSIRLNFGSLYAVIKSLEKHGLIEEARVEREGNRPERIVYAITEDGRTESHEWMRELIGTPVKEYPAFEAGLSLLPLLPPDEAAALLRDRLANLDTELEARAATAEQAEGAGLPELFMLEFHYHVAMTRAERDYVDALLTRLDAGRLGGVEAWTDVHVMRAAGASDDEVQARIEEYFTEGGRDTEQ